MAEDTNFKFGVQIAHEEAYPKIAKLGQLGSIWVTWPTFKFWDPLYI